MAALSAPAAVAALLGADEAQPFPIRTSSVTAALTTCCTLARCRIGTTTRNDTELRSPRNSAAQA